MKKLLLLLLLIPNLAFALPSCEGRLDSSWSNCVGTLTFKNGDTYTGEFKNMKRHGRGTFTFSDGASYTGEHESDNMHGRGTFSYTQLLSNSRKH